MKKLKSVIIAAGLFMSGGVAFAQSFVITSAPSGAGWLPMNLKAEVSTFPQQTSVLRTLNFSAFNSPQSIFVPFPTPPSYNQLTSLTYTRSTGEFAYFTASELTGTGQVTEHFSAPANNCVLFLNKDGNGGYSASVDCAVGIGG